MNPAGNPLEFRDSRDILENLAWADSDLARERSRSGGYGRQPPARWKTRLVGSNAKPAAPGSTTNDRSAVAALARNLQLVLLGIGLLPVIRSTIRVPNHIADASRGENVLHARALRLELRDPRIGGQSTTRLRQGS